eukprot:2108309-Heterocapsa_arctica.AAC.1
MRKQQLTLNRMMKHHILVNKGLENSTEGAALYYKLENPGIETIKKCDIKLDSMRCQIKHDNPEMEELG